MNLKNGKVFTSKFVGTGPSSYEKRIYRAAVSQRLRNTGLEDQGTLRFVRGTRDLCQLFTASYLVTGYQGRFSRDDSACDMQPTTHQQHVPKLTVSGAIPSFPPCPFGKCWNNFTIHCLFFCP